MVDCFSRISLSFFLLAVVFASPACAVGDPEEDPRQRENRNFSYYERQLGSRVESTALEGLKFHCVNAVKVKHTIRGDCLEVTLWRYLDDPSKRLSMTYPKVKEGTFCFMGEYQWLAVLDILEGRLSPREVYEGFLPFSGGNFLETDIGKFLSALPVNGEAISSEKRRMWEDVASCRVQQGLEKDEHLNLKTVKEQFLRALSGGQDEAVPTRRKQTLAIEEKGQHVERTFIDSAVGDNPNSALYEVVRDYDSSDEPLLTLRAKVAPRSNTWDGAGASMEEKEFNLRGSLAQQAFLSIYGGKSSNLDVLQFLKGLFGEDALQKTELGCFIWAIPGLTRQGYSGKTEVFSRFDDLLPLLDDSSRAAWKERKRTKRRRVDE